jgi:hypothetical protein
MNCFNVLTCPTDVVQAGLLIYNLVNEVELLIINKQLTIIN